MNDLQKFCVKYQHQNNEYFRQNDILSFEQIFDKVPAFYTKAIIRVEKVKYEYDSHLLGLTGTVTKIEEHTGDLYGTWGEDYIDLTKVLVSIIGYAE